jgi:ABC-type antimicrobial peptide transport system permease subunit
MRMPILRGRDFTDADRASTPGVVVVSEAMAKQFGSFRARPLALAVRTATDPADAAAMVRGGITQLAADMPVYNVRTMTDRVAESIAPRRFNVFLLAAFAGVALLLASVGIYSVLAYTVRQRVREIGIRMAMGAQGGDMLRLLIAGGMRPTLLGIAIGVAVALALSRVLSALVFGVRPMDVPTFLGGSLLLALVSFLACFIPTYRATKVDPLQALRDE